MRPTKLNAQSDLNCAPMAPNTREVGPQPKVPQNTSERSHLRLDQARPRSHTPLFVYILAFLSALGGLLFGYDTGVISGAMMQLREVFRMNSFWQELVVSMTAAAAAIFALVGGFLNDRLGRRPVILAACLIFTVGSLCMAFANGRFLLLIGRIIVGAGIGLTSMTIPMYIAESTPQLTRGRLVSTQFVMVAVGQLLANIVSGIFSTHQNGWRYMLGLGAVPAALQFLAFIVMPESPRWLITQNRDEDAKEVLQKLRGQADIDDEFQAIKHHCQLTDEQTAGLAGSSPIIWQMVRTPCVRRALLIGCGLQVVQQVAGINTVMYYSATIIKMAGIKSNKDAIWLSAVTAAVNVIFTLIGLILVEKTGRRSLTLASLTGAIISLVWLAVGFNLSALHSPPVSVQETVNQDVRCAQYRNCNACMRDVHCGYCYVDDATGPVNGSCLLSNYKSTVWSSHGRCNSSVYEEPLTWAYDYCPTPYTWMSMAGLVLYLVLFAPGMGPMPWTINSEIYPLWARSTGNAVATFTNWTCNLVVSMSFLSLTESITKFGTFWLYAAMATIGMVFLAICLPETKGKSLEEVEGLFAKPWFGGEAETAAVAEEETIQYVHIRGHNRDGRDSELESPE